MKRFCYLKISLSLVTVLLFSAFIHAQAKPTVEGDYNGTFMNAVSETNSAYPFIFKVETAVFANGKLVKKETQTDENESELHHRSTKIFERGGKIVTVHEILIGEGNGFCKVGNGAWTKSQFVCQDPGGDSELQLMGPRQPERVKYSVEDKKIDGKSVKVYRKYEIFAASKVKGAKKTFAEEIATVDSDGYFISVNKTEGNVGSPLATRTMKETWKIKAKIDPIVAPIK